MAPRCGRQRLTPSPPNPPKAFNLSSASSRGCRPGEGPACEGTQRQPPPDRTSCPWPRFHQSSFQLRPEGKDHEHKNASVHNCRHTAFHRLTYTCWHMVPGTLVHTDRCANADSGHPRAHSEHTCVHPPRARPGHPRMYIHKLTEQALARQAFVDTQGHEAEGGAHS